LSSTPCSSCCSSCHQVVGEEDYCPSHENNHETFLSLPPDQLKVKPPKTNVISDMNRIAQSRTPAPSKDALRKLLDARSRECQPPAAPPPTPQQQAMQEHPSTTQGTEPIAPQPPPTQTPSWKHRRRVRRIKILYRGSPGSAVHQAIQSVAATASLALPALRLAKVASTAACGPKLIQAASGNPERHHGCGLRSVPATFKSDSAKPLGPVGPGIGPASDDEKGTLTIEFAITRDGKVIG